MLSAEGFLQFIGKSRVFHGTLTEGTGRGVHLFIQHTAYAGNIAAGDDVLHAFVRGVFHKPALKVDAVKRAGLSLPADDVFQRRKRGT